MVFSEQIIPFSENLKYKYEAKSDLINEWVNKGIKFIRVVYDEEKDDIIHFSGTSSNNSNIINPTFQDLYELMEKKNDNNLSILKSLYNKVEPELLLNIINKPKMVKTQYLINLLSESNGYMIYHHQFEDFVRMHMSLDLKQSLELRRSWNKKLIKERERPMQNETFYLIEGRMPQYFVFNKVF
jgi:uncharacterized protein YbaP (TraB family)